VTITATDLFCGAGGSSLGAEEVEGVKVIMAANHWNVAIDVHQSHFPDARHDQADISSADPRRYPRTNILLASPECTNHSQARGVSRKAQDPTLWDAPDPSAERSRATMWDVVRFAEQMLYEVIVVENVVEATRWVGWRAWHVAMADLGYRYRVISHNSQDHGVAQSRDRIYIVFWRDGIQIDLDMEALAWCERCGKDVLCKQAWRNSKTIGRYRQQWNWVCFGCGSICEPDKAPASSIINWNLDCPRIGDRARPLAANTRARILAGLQKFGWAPIVTAGAGNTHERTPGNRAKPLTEPLPVQQTTATHALATPPGKPSEGVVCPPFMVKNNGGLGEAKYRPYPITNPVGAITVHPTQSLVIPMRNHGVAALTADVLPTVTAGGNHHGLLVANNANNVPHSTDDPVGAVTTGNRHALLMRNNSGAGEMTTSADEPARTMTAKAAQSLLLPFYSKGQAYPPDSKPLTTVSTHDRVGLVEISAEDLDAIVDDCGFRMLEPPEIAAAMAFPTGYIPGDLPKVHQVKLAGNAVTPPVMAWIIRRVCAALKEAAA
jgi:DNA (cytosine-5)-methyltransferase 1